MDATHRLASTICYHALSVAYLKREGYPIALHTDTLGAAMLGFLPYDDVYTDLDDLPETIHPRFWAAGKMEAVRNEGVGCVHIDGDVFIKRADLAERILGSDGDVIVQDYETAEWTIGDHELLYPLQDELEWLGISVGEAHTGAYNTGVMGINNPDFFDAYLRRYREGAELITAKLGNVFDVNDKATPDLVIEQCNFLQLCRQMNMKVDELLPTYGMDFREHADKIGFQHVLGPRKFLMLAPCIGVLRELDRDIYGKTAKMVENILPYRIISQFNHPQLKELF